MVVFAFTVVPSSSSPDYVKAAVRLSALQGLPVTYAPATLLQLVKWMTHEPIEHLAGLRAVPNLTVFRPADARETPGSMVPGP